MLVFDLDFNINGIVNINIHRFGGELAVLFAVGLSLKAKPKAGHFNFVIILSALKWH